jgi:hypothetical protein
MIRATRQRFAILSIVAATTILVAQSAVAASLGTITSPAPGSTLPSTTVTFTWAAGTGVTAYELDAGSRPEGTNYYQSGNLGNVFTATASGLPDDGSTVYVTLWSLWNGEWYYNEYTYTAYSLYGKGVITSPTPGSALTGSTVTFTWAAGTNDTAYWIDAGSTPGGSQYFQSGNLGNVLSAIVSGLPVDGSTVYVTLWSLASGEWFNNQYTYASLPNYSFAAAQSFAVGVDPWQTAVGDFNGDGKLDLVTANQYGNSVSVLLGNGDGTFQPAVSYGVGYNPSWVAVGDFNGDGKLDLAVADTFGLTVLLGNGDGTFRTATNYNVGSPQTFVTVADLNGDGKLDLVFANSDSNNVTVVLGDGDGTFQSPISYVTGTGPRQVVVRDFNNDGNPDLAAANGNNTVSVLLGNGDGTFHSPVDYSVGSLPSGLIVGDFNSDGKPDLVVANQNSSTVSVLVGNADGTFQPAVNYSSGPYPMAIAAADFNLDGKLDVVVVNGPSANNDTVSVLLGNGAGGFYWPVAYGSFEDPVRVTTGDFNGDGKPDIVVTNSETNNVSVILNTTPVYIPAVITSPTPGSTLPGSSLTFSWTAGAGATAYWIDAGSAPGGNQYFQSGNLGNVTSATVSGLPTNGVTIYVTLYSLLNGQWYSNQYTYTAFNLAGSLGVMTSPVPGSVLPGSTVTFNWSPGAGASAYWLDLGNVATGNQYYQSGNLGNVQSVTVNGLPADGTTVYATLWSLVSGQWFYNEYTYTASVSGSLAIMRSPMPGTTLYGSAQTFTWAAGNGATAYWLDIGSSPTGNNYYQSGNLGNILSTTVYSLPADGSQIYVTLWSLVNNQWYYNEYTYISSP